MPTCPECDSTLEFAAQTLIGEVLPCGSCGVDLEVTALEPPRLQLAPEIEEDWGE